MSLKSFLYQLYRKCRHILGLLKVRCSGQAALELNGDKHFFIFGTPNHGNLGDSAISFAQEDFLKSLYPDYKTCFIDETAYWKYKNALKNKISKNDILTFVGGGNMGSLYPYSEDLRRDVIKTFPDNIKVIFPQTIYFFQDVFGRYDKMKMEKLYNKDKNIYLFAREEYSFEIMKKIFGADRVFLVPDIVLSLKSLLPEEGERKGALTCFRADEETKLTADEKAIINNKLYEAFGILESTDTVVPYYNGVEESREEVRKKLEQFSKAEIVVTDRLHGMVFAAITKTPCIALSNYNKKVLGVYKWISELSYIKYIDNVSDFDVALDTVLNCEKNDSIVFKKIDSYFKPLEDILKN